MSYKAYITEIMMIQRFIILFAFCVAAIVPAAQAQEEPAIATAAKQAIVVDYDTGMVLMEKNADARMPTSSMSKVMTMYMVFEALKRGELALDDKLLVSEKAWRKGGSKMFVEVDKQVRVEDLIRGVIVQSGNDATIVLAEGLAGSESAFADSMTLKAQELGMDASNFKNASGWPDPDHYSTARDLATLGVSLIRNFPEYYNYYSEREFTFNNITQRNRNPLLYRDIGADGIKTGHTQAGGYGVIGSGTRDGRRVVLVVNGLTDSKARAQESAKLLDWGLRRFSNHTLYTAGEVITEVPVVFGRQDKLPVTVQEDVFVTLPRLAKKGFQVSATYNSPLTAPIQKGQEIGTLRIDMPHMNPVERPLLAAQDVAKQGFFSLTIAKAKRFFSSAADEKLQEVVGDG